MISRLNRCTWVLGCLLGIASAAQAQTFVTYYQPSTVLPTESTCDCSTQTAYDSAQPLGGLTSISDLPPLATTVTAYSQPAGVYYASYAAPSATSYVVSGSNVSCEQSGQQHNAARPVTPADRADAPPSSNLRPILTDPDGHPRAARHETNRPPSVRARQPLKSLGPIVFETTPITRQPVGLAARTRSE